jgi:xanthine dehydrogenase accessory factor
MTFSLGQDAAYDNGLICGGQLEVFIEPVEPQPRAIIFGAGHISKSLCQVTGMIGFQTAIVDNRESFANAERFPQADEIFAAEYEDVFGKLEVNSSTYLIIVTRGHRDDMRVLRWAITTDACYIGMIGSRRKALAVYKELEKEGIARDAFERVRSPMGLDIAALSPEEIAVSVAAEMIAIRRRAASNWRALSKSIFAAAEVQAVPQ